MSSYSGGVTANCSGRSRPASRRRPARRRDAGGGLVAAERPIPRRPAAQQRRGVDGQPARVHAGDKPPAAMGAPGGAEPVFPPAGTSHGIASFSSVRSEFLAVLLACALSLSDFMPRSTWSETCSICSEIWSETDLTFFDHSSMFSSPKTPSAPPARAARRRRRLGQHAEQHQGRVVVANVARAPQLGDCGLPVGLGQVAIGVPIGPAPASCIRIAHSARASVHSTSRSSG